MFLLWLLPMVLQPTFAEEGSKLFSCVLTFKSRLSHLLYLQVQLFVEMNSTVSSVVLMAEPNFKTILLGLFSVCASPYDVVHFQSVGCFANETLFFSL
jgi:hypothetical protein